MKKWYICTFIVAFALLSLISKEQSALPNQEIVLQFSDKTVTSSEAQNTIAIVEKQLEDFGAKNIQIQKIEDGQLRITYYSNLDVASIKETFSEENELVVDYSNGNNRQVPFEKNEISFNLDVFKIQDNNDAESGFDGTIVLEPRPESDRYHNNNVHFYGFGTEDIRLNAFVAVACKVNSNVAIAIDNTSYKIPEVRAGPITNKPS